MDTNYDEIYLTIDSFDTMKTFLQNLLSGAYDDKVIKLIGNNSTRISNCAVMISNGSGLRLGCSWEVEGGTYPDDYPYEDAKLELTGVIRIANEYGARVLYVTKENVRIL